MAIVIEEEKRSGGNWGTIIVIIAVVVALLVTAYYIFFNQPQLVEVATPAGFQNTIQISQIHLDPGEVVNSAQFKALQSYAVPLTPQFSGRLNPFLGTF